MPFNRKRLLCALLPLVLLLVAGSAHAADMLMARIEMKGELTLAYVRSSIEEHGYTIAHEQTCDSGLGDFGYHTDLYRVVFFGKVDEVRRMVAANPEMAAFLPLKMAVIAEEGNTLLSIVNPQILAHYFPDPEMQVQFGRWRNDILSIFDDIKVQERTRKWQRTFEDDGERPEKPQATGNKPN